MLRTSCLVLLLAGCDAAPSEDPAVDDAAALDGAALDATPLDAAPDAAPLDAAPLDATPDAALPPPLPSLEGPAVAPDLDPDPRVVEIELRASAARYRLGADLEIDGLAYNGQSPGPTIQARVGDELVVRFKNDLDEATTIHWHGLRIPDDMDGSPRIQAPVQPGETFTYRFVLPDAGTFWYHPHVNAHTDVELGLQGMLIVHEAEPPVFAQERLLVIDDVLVENGRIPPPFRNRPELMHGRYGNLLLTNGTTEPKAGVAREGDVERWRLVNTANGRFMDLSLEGARFRVIGTDGGLLAQPYETQRLSVAIGQRYDLEVTYDRPGTARLISHIPVLEGENVVVRPFDIQSIEVAATGSAPQPVALPQVAPPARGRANQTAVLTFTVVEDAETGVRWLLNGQDGGHDSHHAGHPEPMFTFQQGDYVRLVLDNRAGPTHPFHLHGQFFEILPDGRPETEQPGLKDTVLVPGLSQVTVFARMDNPGRWMAHCHILEHASLGMMTEFLVEPAE